MHEIGPVRFAWGIPCRVRARQQRIESGKEAVLTFDVVVEPRGDELAVRFERTTFVSFDGVDLSDPRAIAKLSPAVAIELALPTFAPFAVSNQGRYLRTDDLPSTIDAVVAGVSDPAMRETIARIMALPHLQGTLQQASGEQWHTWVGTWLGWRLPPGKPAVSTSTVDLSAGITLPVIITRETLGRVDGAPSLLRLRAHQVTEGEQAARALAATAQRLGEQIGEVPAGTIERFRQETTATVELDASTARPHRARLETLTEIDDDIRRLEVQDTTFDWSGATGPFVSAPPS